MIELIKDKINIKKNLGLLVIGNKIYVKKLNHFNFNFKK
jgi:hypothetical protein